MSNLNNPQISLVLDPRVVASGFENDGQDVPAAGQIASLTSTNNFINFCLTVPTIPITNGQQITEGSCNPAPLGLLPSVDLIPSCKFSFPRNQGVIGSSTTFTVVLSVRNLQAGFLANAFENYMSAPQILNAQGTIQGHVAIVIETIEFSSTTPPDPKKFAFFRVTPSAGTGNGDGTTNISIDVESGLPPGAYRLSSMLRTTNSAPILPPTEMRGSSNDIIYFTVVNGFVYDILFFFYRNWFGMLK
ncbi:hypothetical protein P691DRAFT_8518 [Macrolepiota fuliginosa MF-IS2]|uniref:Uncharacterized protein n=1 Tax=Macrolepiota fuliginosa MF-IS2 TaxID=1400762 RepID=A0A9P6CBE5_9AGAR|nr:hypothetical protein P691DRAFT_8518 [Macrolepiota fuliginosa MF-IS2]